jgi:hypothetical protein
MACWNDFGDFGSDGGSFDDDDGYDDYRENLKNSPGINNNIESVK